jgi:hypothetical protein
MNGNIQRMAGALSGFVLALSVAGCSSLSVQVDVLRPETVSARAEADAIVQAMPLIAAEDDLSVERVFAEIINAHFGAYQDLADKYRVTASALPAGSEEHEQLEGAAESLASLTPTMREFYQRKEGEVKATNASLRKLWTDYQAATDATSREQLAHRLTAQMAERRAILASVYAMIGHDLDGRVADLPQAAATSAAATIVTAESEVRQKLTQLFDGGGLIDSRYTFYVVSAAETEWAPMFDRTFANGLFGNTDIAIKALGPGNFTIKGLSFNPADVAATAAKVTTQTVLLAAQIAGVPVKVSGTPDPQTNGAALATSSSALAQTLSQSAQVDQRVVAHRDALMRIASVILQERGTIATGTAADRKASLDVIKAVYSSHAARLPVTVD